MDEARFTIDADPGRKLLRITLRGFWDDATMRAYDAAVRDAGDRMAAGGCPRADILALVDARALSAQAQDLVAAYKERFNTPDRQPRRLATVVRSSLLKRQVERIAFPNQRIFEDEREALDWLTAAD